MTHPLYIQPNRSRKSVKLTKDLAFECPECGLDLIYKRPCPDCGCMPIVHDMGAHKDYQDDLLSEAAERDWMR